MTKSKPCYITEEGIVGLSGPRLGHLLESFLGRGQSCRMRVHGSSMIPFIRHGDIATIEPLKRRPRAGDVVAASTDDGGRVILHRVVKVKKGTSGMRLLLKGDSGCDDAEWTDSCRVLGSVTKVSRMGRKVGVGSGITGRAASSFARRLISLRKRRNDR